MKTNHTLGRSIRAALGIGAVSLAVGMAFITPAQAAGPVQWTGNNSGDWTDGGNWDTAAPPQTGDDALVTDSGLTGSEEKNVTYADPGGVGTLNSVVVTGAAASNMTLNQAIDTLTTSTLSVGASGTGTYNLSGTGVLDVTNIANGVTYVGEGVGGIGQFTQQDSLSQFTTNYLNIGNETGSTGIYDLSGGTLTVNNNLNVGGSGQGTFTQTGGSVGVSDTLYVNGNTDGSTSGQYTMNGGILSTNNVIVADQGIGTFNQDNSLGDSTHTVTGNLTVGNQLNSTGTYTLTDMTGGSTALSLNVGGDAVIGYQGNGTFTQDSGSTAGVNITGALRLGGSGPLDVFANQGTGTYNLISGTLTAGSTSVGDVGTGVFNNNSGGTHNAGHLSLGSTGSSGGNSFGSYNLGGTGVLNADGADVGVFGRGEFNQSGGTATIGTIANNNSLQIGIGPEQPAGPSNSPFREGIYTQSGGDLTVNGSTIVGAGNSFFATEPGGKGTFTQTGGTHTVTGDFVVGQFGSKAGGNGTYNLSGTGDLENNGMVVAQEGATGVFNQSGGTANVAGFLTVGEDKEADGTYTLSGGTLTTQNAIIGSGSLSNSTGGTGLFHQTGGDYTTGFLNVGGGGFGLQGTGHYQLDAGNLIVDNDIVLGNEHGGHGTFTQNGGSTQVNSPNFGMYINDGNYTLNSGSLAVANNEFVGDVASGSVDQTGGTHSVGADLILGNQTGVTGTYNLTGGGLTVTGTTYVGNQGQGIFNQQDATHTTGSLVLGSQAGSTGAYTLTDPVAVTTLNVTGNEVVGDAGVGTFAQHAGTHTVGGDLTIAKQSSASGSSFTLDNTAGPGPSSLAVTGNLVVGQGGNGSFTQTGGSNTVTGNVDIATQAGSTGSAYNLSGGTLLAANMNVDTGGTLNFSGGVFSLGSGSGTLANEGQVNISGSGIRTVDANVVNDGNFKVTDTTVVYTGDFTNNGGYNSDPSTNIFTNLTVGANGYLSGGPGDIFQIYGNYFNNSTQYAQWETSAATLEFTGPTHQMTTTGNFGDFNWGSFILDSGASLDLNGILTVGLFDLMGGLSQLSSLTGNYIIYYDQTLAGNAYLNNSGNPNIRGYTPSSSNVPEPATWTLLGFGLFGLLFRRRRS